ncbi:MAG: hypothetical protein A2Z25_01230 [Planctomycetes bacterium RBG_16_55_9]|nr:MAG: hypothetical protein A2Z25_01230 [Planctomycetes bacterium RBG_16_55_9]
MSKTHHFSLQPSETVIFQAAANIYASYIVAGQVTDENQTEKMKEAIGASISMARNVQSVVDSDTQMSGQARRRLSNTVREEDSMPHK